MFYQHYSNRDSIWLRPELPVSDDKAVGRRLDKRTREQTEKLYNLVLEYTEANDKTSIVDAYCGVGTISLMLAKKAKYVYGIEVVKEAIINAKQNAKKNDIKNVEFKVAKVEDVINDYINKDVNTIVVDPPRKGLDQNVVKALLDSNIKRIVYVSCNPTSFARDLNLLKEKLYM